MGRCAACSRGAVSSSSRHNTDARHCKPCSEATGAILYRLATTNSLVYGRVLWWWGHTPIVLARSLQRVCVCWWTPALKCKLPMLIGATLDSRADSSIN